MPRSRRRLIATLALLVVGCGGSDDVPSGIDLEACVRHSGAELDMSVAAMPESVARGTRTLFAATWPSGGSAIVHRASTPAAAVETERRLKQTVRAFKTPADQVERQGGFVVLLGPAQLPTREEADALDACLGDSTARTDGP